MFYSTGKYTYLLFLLLLLFGQNGMGQNSDLPPYYYSHRVYTAVDGLTSTNTTAVNQDQNGFIWVATREGINKFDGLQFENHLNNPAFPDDRIMWLGLYGETIFFSGNEGIYQYVDGNIINHLPGLSKRISPSHIEIDGQKIWIRNELNTNCLYWIEEGKLDSLYLKMSQSNKHLRFGDFKLTDEGDLLIMIENTLSRGVFLLRRKPDGSEEILSPTSQKVFATIQFNKPFSEPYIRFDQEIYAYEQGKFRLIHRIPFPFKLFCLRGDQLFATTRTRLFAYRNGKWLDFGLDLNQVISLFIDQEGKLWIVSEEGLVKIRNKAMECYPKERGMKRNTWTILEDDQQQYWFAAYRYGLTRLNQDQQYVEVSGQDNELLPGNSFYTGGIKRANGDLLFPGSAQVLQYHPRKGFSLLPGSFEQLSSFQDIKEYNDTLFLATNGFKIISPDGSSLFLRQTDGLDLNELRYIEAIERDKNNIWWLVSHFGLAKYDGQFTNYYKGKELKDGLNCVFKDYRDNLWFGSHKGLLHYDYTTEIPQEIIPDSIINLKASVKFISAIDSSHLVLGMLDKVVLLDLKKYYQDQTIEYISIDIENGFEGEDCIQGSGYVDSKGHIWIASRTMVHKLIPEEIDWNHYPRKVLIDQVMVQEKGAASKRDTIRFQDATKLEKELVFYNGVDISFHFLSVDHTNPQKTHYQYRLKGYENSFSSLSSLRFANYTNLPIDEYQFEVRSSLNNRYSEITTVPFEVKPAFFLEHTWVQIALAIFSLSIALYLILRERNIRKKAKKLEQKLFRAEYDRMKLQQSFLYNQVKPHFTFNILNAIEGLIEENRLRESLRYIGQFGDLFRSMLYDDKKLSRTLQEEIDFVQNYLMLEKVRFSKKFDYEVDVEKEVDQGVFIPKMSIQTFVNNAIKHGFEKLPSGGKLRVYVRQKENFVIVSITDNGKGRKENGNAGKGISIVEEMLNWFNQQRPDQPKSYLKIIDLLDGDGQAAGTRVEIYLNANYKHL